MFDLVIIEAAIGIAVLIFSSHTLVRSAEKISRVFRLSPLIVGTTIVALGTSLPELAVSTIALARQDPGLAMGNLIGSNITNIFLVLPVGILIGKLRIGTTKTQRNALLLFGVTTIFILLLVLSFPAIFSGLFLIALAVSFTIEEYELGVFGRTHEDSAKFKSHKIENFSLGKILSVILATAGVILGGVLVVNSVEKISILTGYSTTILGLSLTAVATSLPELLTTIFSQEENQEKITIGNIIGSNIYNLLFIGGIVTLFSKATTLVTKDWLWLILATACFVGFLRFYSGKYVPRWVGASFLLLFFIYLITLV